jgi:hypothetical protein
METATPPIVPPAPPAAEPPENNTPLTPDPLLDLKARPAVKVTSLTQIAAFHNEPIGAKVYCYDQVFHFEGRRLNPDETQRVKRLLEKAIPPRNDKNEYDFDAPGYLEARETYKRHARALCVWLAFPALFQTAAVEQKADVGDAEKLTKFVESQALNDEALDVLFGTATTSPVSLVELTGFISGSNSPKS